MYFKVLRDGKLYDVKEFPSIVDVRYHELNKHISFRVQYGTEKLTFAEFRFAHAIDSQLPIDKQQLAGKIVRGLIFRLYGTHIPDVRVIQKRIDHPSSIDVGWPWLDTYVVDQPFTVKLQVNVVIQGFDINCNLWLQRYETEERLADYARVAFNRIIHHLHYDLSFNYGSMYNLK
jgi:hypothetical protein